jgi:hypothetical protein
MLLLTFLYRLLLPAGLELRRAQIRVNTWRLRPRRRVRTLGLALSEWLRLIDLFTIYDVLYNSV